MKKFLKILSIILIVILVACEGYFSFKVLSLNMLPGQYLWIFLGIMVLLALLMAALLLIPQRKMSGRHIKDTRKPIRQIIGAVLAVMVSAVCIFGSVVVGDVQDTMDTVTENTVISGVVGVYVPTGDKAVSITDAKSYSFAVTESYDWENTQKTLMAIEAETGSKPTTETYDTVTAMVDALKGGEAQALILNTAYVSLLEDMEEYQDFRTDTKLLYEFKVDSDISVKKEPEKKEEEKKEPEQLEPEEVKKDESKAPFVVYLSGSDTRSTTLVTSRSDVNILAVVNPETKQLLLVNTPRDYYIPNPAGGGSLDKLTHCGIYGVDCSMEALGDLYGVEVNDYAQINFTGMETLIDAIGGVTVYSDVSFYTRDGYVIYYGENNMNGPTALSFARERYALSGGDNARGKNQMKVITAIVDKATSGGTVLTNYSEILSSMEGTFATSMSQTKISELVKMQLEDMSPWNIKSFAVTGFGDSRTTYSMAGSYSYVMWPDETVVAQASGLINKVLEGGTITDADLEIKTN